MTAWEAFLLVLVLVGIVGFGVLFAPRIVRELRR